MPKNKKCYECDKSLHKRRAFYTVADDEANVEFQSRAQFIKNTHFLCKDCASQKGLLREYKLKNIRFWLDKNKSQNEVRKLRDAALGPTEKMCGHLQDLITANEVERLDRHLGSMLTEYETKVEQIESIRNNLRDLGLI